ncbi:DUF4280 domain-containing protein [Aquimarina sp. I32.4]|uniref:DUF4280 domain-containing protein n=1 Tax=Aquimarina sp. I32.4 TaxID=2053903 RepID=UPI000CDE6E0F|nr:DUF4280 domain-containing protein [Aquimarina sp. I32.4]
MSNGHVVVNGAICKCKFGNTPDTLVVQSQQKAYINDAEGGQKLVGNTMDIGMPLQAKTFGQCKLQPSNSGYLPCIPSITGWQDFYDKVELHNSGQVLTENSKGTCAIAGAPCIEFTWHGQTAAPGSSNVAQAEEKVQVHLNPLVNITKMKKVPCLILPDNDHENQPKDVITTVSNTKKVGNKIKRDVKLQIKLSIVNLTKSNLTKTMFNKEKGIVRLKNFEGAAENYDVENDVHSIYNIIHFTIDYIIRESLSTIPEDDHVMIIVKEIPAVAGESASSNPVGRAELGGRISAVESRTISNKTFDEVSQHEIGHNLGLEHSDLGDLMYKYVNGNISLSKKKKGDIVSNQVTFSQGNKEYKESSSGSNYDSNKLKKFRKTIKKRVENFIEECKIEY